MLSMHNKSVFSYNVNGVKHMLYIIGCIFLVILSVLGVVHLIEEIVFKVTSNKSGNNFMIVNISHDNEENAEYLLRSAAERAKWFGKNFSTKIICVDSGMSEEARKICTAVCGEYDFMEIMDAHKICDLFKL